MDLLIILCFVYAVYRAGLDAAVNSYALSRGRDVYLGEGENRRRYSGWTLGAALAVLWMSLLEGWKAGWQWGGRRRDEIKARRAARPQPATGQPEVVEPDAAPWDGPPPDEPPGSPPHRSAPTPNSADRPKPGSGDPGRDQPPTPPPADIPADVVDGSGRPVNAVWELPAARWPSMHTGRPE
jgi:hypothetical protein